MRNNVFEYDLNKSVMQLDKKVVVVCGGVSTEREVSLHSGKAIFDALQRKGF